jgi:WD40 repeat protein
VPLSAQSSAGASQLPEAVLQTGHRRAVRAIAFSPDGRWLASGAKDNTIKIWEVSTGRVLRTLHGHGSAVNAVAISPDGRLLASGSGNTFDVRYGKLYFKGGEVGGQREDTTVRIWEVSSGRLLRTIYDHKLAVLAVAFSRDGQTVTSASGDLTEVSDVATGNAVRSVKAYPVKASNSIGRSLLGGGAAKDTQAETWEKTFKTLATQAFASRDGATVVIGFPGKKFRLFEAAQGAEGPDIDLEASPETDQEVALSPDGQSVAFIKDGKTVVVQGTGRDKHGWQASLPQTGSGALLTFSTDGHTLLAQVPSGSRQMLYRWEVGSSAQPQESAFDDNRGGRTLGFSPDAHTIALVAKGSHDVELRDTATGRLVRLLGAPELAIHPQPDPNSEEAALQNDLRKLGITQPGELLEAEDDVSDFSSKYHAGEAITFTPDNKWLIIKRGRPKELVTVVWENTIGTPLNDSSRAEFKSIGNPDASPDGKFNVVPEYAQNENKVAKSIGLSGITSSPYDQAVRLVDVQNGQKVHTFKVGRVAEWGMVPAAGFSTDSSRVAVSGFKGFYRHGIPTEIFIFNVASGDKVKSVLYEIDEDSGLVDALAVSDDGNTVAAGFRNKVVLLDSTSGKVLAANQNAGGIVGLSFSHDGRMLAALGKDGDAYLFDTSNGQQLATLINVTATSANATSNDWLVVTPDGKFDGSPSGWNQILWRFGGDTFNVAPVEIFFNEFYYPGLLADILAGKQLRATRSFQQIDRRQPSVAIVAPNAGGESVSSRTVTLKVDVSEAPADSGHAQGSGVRDVRLFRNGSVVKVWRGDVQLDAAGKASLEATVPILAGDNRLTAYAFNHDNIKSADAMQVVTGAPSLMRPGTAYVLSVGINRYENPDYNLKFADADAQDVVGELKTQQAKVGNIGKVVVVPLYDEEATKGNILLALQKLAGTATASSSEGAPTSLAQLQPAEPEDAIFIFFAGHGVAVGPRFYLIPHDLGYTGKRTQIDEAASQTILAHSISDVELEDALEKVDARDLVLVIDACNSGQALEAEEKRRGPMNSKGLAQLAYEKGMYVMTASQRYQAALEAAELGHGLLTYALVEEGLKTAAADRQPKDGKIVAKEWLDYATDRVPDLQEMLIEQAQKQGRAISFAEVDESQRGSAARSGLQRPRVFYRREVDSDSLIVAKP